VQTSDSALDRAIACLDTQAALAVALGVRSPSISEWRRNGVPIERCVAIEAATAGAIRCEDLRPDIEWTRDPATGQVTGYHVRVEIPAPLAQAAPAKVA
jgi:DNA-binding transcriptional regulator YdaS (Cro superfamily)